MRQWFEDCPCPLHMPSVLLGLWLKEKGQSLTCQRLSCLLMLPFFIFLWIGLKLLTSSSSSSEQECLHWDCAISLPPQSLRLRKNLDLRKWGHLFPEELLLPVSCASREQLPRYTAVP